MKKDPDIEAEYEKGFKVTELFILDPEEIATPELREPPNHTAYRIRIKPDMNMQIIREIERNLGLGFEPEPEEGNVCFAYNNAELRADFKQVFTPLDILNYAYGILNSPAFHEKYKVFFKANPPRVPYPKDTETFWELVDFGDGIRENHL